MTHVDLHERARDAVDRYRPGRLVIRFERRDGFVVLLLQGELDLATGPSLEQRLCEAEGTGSTRIVLDVSELQFMDSTGLHVLLRAHERSRAYGRELVLRAVPPAIQRILELTGTHRVLHLEP